MFSQRLNKFYKKYAYSNSYIGIFINPFYISRSSLYRHVKNYANEVPGGKLLDVGCGSKPYEKLFSVDSYEGIDIKISGHDHGSSKIDFYFDGENMPFNDQTYDHVISTEVFEHSFNLDSLLTEVRRVLKKDGELFFTVPFCWNEHEVPYDFARYTQFGLRHILKTNGFEVVDIKKSTTFIETILQLLITYLFLCVFPNNKYLRIMLVPFFITPLTLLAIFASRILPDDKSLPLNLIVRAKI